MEHKKKQINDLNRMNTLDLLFVLDFITHNSKHDMYCRLQNIQCIFFQCIVYM